MSEIDWSNAPEGATHFHLGDSRYNPHWYKRGYFCVTGFESYGWVKDSFNTSTEDYVKRQSASWTGKGLPPVGTVCERNIARSAWCETNILAASSDGSHIAYQDMAGQIGWSRSAEDFRPIRTSKQIAAEERAKSIEEIYQMISGQMGHLNVRELAAEIYEAGFRKQGDQP